MSEEDRFATKLHLGLLHFKLPEMQMVSKHPYNPWYKATYAVETPNVRLQLRVPHDVFSTQRIDEGTMLLLDHLAPGQPAKILDMGCGYGALGLPLAARHPQAQVEMVDRDLLAAQWSAENARNNQLANVRAYGSLGYRDVSSDKYDWIVCNVPARIGRPFIRYLIQVGRGRLNVGGDLRIVVINDLSPIIRELDAECGWSAHEVQRGPRHTVFAFGAQSASATSEEFSDEKLYFRDQVTLAGMTLSRPFDLGGDDPKRLAQGLPVLLDALPRAAKLERVLCFRSGYGFLPLICRERWPQARVVAMDRDLLATTFIKLNAARLGLGENLEIREHAHFPDSIREGEKFDLILGELSPGAGEAVLQAELRAISSAIAQGGQAYLLCLDKIEREWVRPFAAKSRLALTATIKREGYTVLRLA